MNLVGPNGFGLHRAKTYDLAKTDEIADLLKTPTEERGQQWAAAFLPALWYASLRAPEDPADYIFDAPNGFPYLRLALPEPGMPFQAHCIAGVLRFCFARSIGVALFNDLKDAPGSAVFSLTLGELDALYRFGTRGGDPDHIPDLAPGFNESVLQSGTRVWHGIPVPSVLPPYVASAMAHHMKNGWGIAEPKASYVVFADKPNEQNIMVNATPADLPVDPKIAQAAFFRLRFYMPGHLALMPLVRPDLVKGMHPLAEFAAVPTAWDAEG